MKNEQKKIATTALKLLQRKKWNTIELNEIKKKSKVKSFDKIIKNKQDVLRKINNYFDYQLSLSIRNIEKSDNKDMIFEIIMMRFDILQNYRKAILSLFNSFKQKPKQLIFLLPELLDSILNMVKVTNISYKGIKGQLKIKGVFIIYISTFLTWVKDETESLEKTMTALDKYLDQAGSMLKIIK